MDGFLKISGMAIFAIALCALVVLAMTTKGVGIIAALYALPAMVGGAAIYALGAILNNIIAIREASDRQAAALAQMVFEKKDKG